MEASTIRNKELDASAIIKVSVVSFVGIRTFLIKYSNGHTK